VVAIAAASVIGCSSGSFPTTDVEPGPSPQVSSPAANTGTIAMRLALGGETPIDSVAYTLQNGASVVQSGVQVTHESAGIDFELGSIPAGAGYTVTLTAASPDGGVHCLGASGTFSVLAHSTVTERVQLICTSGVADVGNLLITGLESFCGTWQSVSTIGPATSNGSEVFADGLTPMVITATGNGADTSALAYNWSVLSSTGGGVTLGVETGNGTTTSTQTLTCNPSMQAGGAVIQLVVTDSEDGGAVTCPATLSTVTVDVTCDPYCSIDCAPPASARCGTCPQPYCANLQADSNNCGGCGHQCTNGTVCLNGTCACPLGQGLCGGTCTSLTTPLNCGACGVLCPGACNVPADGGTASCG
jgi:hypothetical protein